MKLIVVLAATAMLSTACQSIIAPVTLLPVQQISNLQANDADVIIVGSSLAGWAAAIASAREGADTVLITETKCVGGQASCAGVSTWDGTGAGIDQTFRNDLEYEYKLANVQLGGCYSPVASVGPNIFEPNANFCPHPDRVEDELLSWLNFYGVRLVGPTPVISIGTDGSVTTPSKVFRANVVIEATETGKLIPAPLRRVVSPTCKQDVTWVAGLRQPGLGGSKVEDFVYPTNPSYMKLLNDWWTNPKYHWAGLTGEQGLPVYRRTHDLNGDLVIYLNWMNDAPTAGVSLDRTKQMIVFLASKGYGEWRWELRPQPYIRTSDFRLNGQQRLGATPRGVDSYFNSVSVSQYRTDYHGVTCGGMNAAEPYGNYDIPMGIGIPKIRVPILVAMPRSADITDMRSTSFRMQPDEITFGEAMGTLGAIAALRGVLPQDVPPSDVRSSLIKNGARVDV